MNDAGTEEETASVFVVVPGNVMSSCDTTIMGCETFGGGTWVQAGGQCSKEGSEEALTAVIGSDTNETLAEGECKLQPGIAGGGHMDREAFWSSKCSNSNSSYSMPRRWMADTETVTTQNKISRYVLPSIYHSVPSSIQFRCLKSAFPFFLFHYTKNT